MPSRWAPRWARNASISLAITPRLFTQFGLAQIAFLARSRHVFPGALDPFDQLVLGVAQIEDRILDPRLVGLQPLDLAQHGLVGVVGRDGVELDLLLVRLLLAGAELECLSIDGLALFDRVCLQIMLTALGPLQGPDLLLELTRNLVSADGEGVDLGVDVLQQSESLEGLLHGSRFTDGT